VLDNFISENKLSFKMTDNSWSAKRFRGIQAVPSKVQTGGGFTPSHANRNSQKRAAAEPLSEFEKELYASMRAQREAYNASEAAKNKVTAARKNENRFIVRTWRLSDNITLTITFEAGWMVVKLGNIERRVFGDGSKPMLTIGASEMKTLFGSKWDDDIAPLIGKKVAKFPIPVNAEDAVSSDEVAVQVELDYTDESSFQTSEPIVIFSVPSQPGQQVSLFGDGVAKLCQSVDFMHDRIAWLMDIEPCYHLMLDEIVRCCKAMSGGGGGGSAKPDFARCVGTITTLNLTMRIVEAYEAGLVKRNIKPDVNTYSLFNFCMGQIDSLQARYDMGMPMD